MGLTSEARLEAALVLDVVSSEDGFAVWSSRREQMIDDAGEFVGGCGDGLGGTELGSHPAVEGSQCGGTAQQGLGGEAQGVGKAMLDVSRADGENLATGYPVVRAQTEPGSEVLMSGEP